MSIDLFLCKEHEQQIMALPAAERTCLRIAIAKRKGSIRKYLKISKSDCVDHFNEINKILCIQEFDEKYDYNNKETYYNNLHYNNTSNDTSGSRGYEWAISLFLAFMWKYDPAGTLAFYETELSFIELPEEGSDLEHEDAWLDPRNHFAIPFVGRQKELDLLDDFAKDRSAFQVWAIIASSGAGKTRMTRHWVHAREAVKGWDKKFLHTSADRDVTTWHDWTPQLPTLIVIDYMFEFKNVLRTIIERGKTLSEQGKNTPIRLLILDHTFEELKDIIKDPFSGFYGKNSRNFTNDYGGFFFNKGEPMRLETTQDQDEIIDTIISKLAEGVSQEIIDTAKKRLREMKNGWHPLFAALAGDALKNRHAGNIERWNRRTLINIYLSGKDRTPWQRIKGEDKWVLEGQWAGAFVSAATARRNVEFEILTTCAGDTFPEGYTIVKSMCRRIVACPQTKILPAFEPDILGESFFLRFLEFLDEAEPAALREAFIQMLCHGEEQTQIEDAISFIAFITRLARNLSNDDINDPETQKFWGLLLQFLNSAHFPKDSLMSWAVSAVMVIIADHMKYIFNNQIDYIKFFNIIKISNVIDINTLCDNIPNALTKEPYKYLEKVLEFYFCYHRLYESMGEKPQISNSLNVLVQRYHEACHVNKNFFNAITLAVATGTPRIIKYIIDQGIDVDCPQKSGITALMLAAESGSTEIVELLLQHEADVDSQDKDGATALMLAAQEGHTETAKLLLQHKAGVDAKSNTERTALMLAGQNGHTKTVALLLQYKADVHSQANNEATALMFATKNGHTETAALLIQHKADVNTQTNHGATALMLAAHGGHMETAELLLQHKADIHAKGNDGVTALILAAQDGHAETTELLLQHKADINAKGNGGTTALRLAAHGGYTETVELLLQHKADINAKGNDGATALMPAAHNGHTETAELLLQHGADVNAQDNDRRTALMLAVQKGYTKTAKVLLQHRANVHAQTNNEATALMFAAHNGHTETAALLLQYKADVDAKDDKGWTVLMLAVHNGHIESTKLLLQHNVDLYAQANEGTTALMLAPRKECTEITELLLQHKVGVNTQDNYGSTALILAAHNGYTEATELLLQYGADVNTQDNRRRTALILALQSGYTKTAKLLLRHGADVNAQDDNETTALILAAEGGYTEIAELLLQHGADVNAQYNDGRTVLAFALSSNHIDIVELLLKKKPHLELRFKGGITALTLACVYNYVEIAEKLIEKGAKINTTDDILRTPLHYVCLVKNIKCIQLLLKRGADTKIRDVAGKSPLDIAKQTGNQSIIDLLEQHLKIIS